ncbi:MAG: HAMP domain-containing protein [Armatimonadetes bacterium]|nr:HAMP domain-containing protein [Armatimonadota bacterium]
MRLTKDFHIETDPLQRLFVTAMTQALLTAGAAAAALGLLLSAVLFRRVVLRLRGTTAMAERIAAGDYGARIVVPDRDEVGALADSVNRMGAALQPLEDLRKDLVANVVHELRTPLTTLRGYLEAMQDGVVTPDPEAIALLHDEVIRLLRLIDALHQLSSFDARVPRPRLATVDVAGIAARLVRPLGGGIRRQADPDRAARRREGRLPWRR